MPCTVTDGQGCEGDSICLLDQFHKEAPSEKTMDKSEVPAGTGRYSSVRKVIPLVAVTGQL